MHKVTIIIKYYIKYLILLLLFKNINLLLPITFNDFTGIYSFVYIPISYLVVKYMFIYDLEKHQYSKDKYVLPIIFGYTILNFILSLPLIYNIFIVIFLICLKGVPVIDEEEIAKNIKEYYQNKNK